MSRSWSSAMVTMSIASTRSAGSDVGRSDLPSLGRLLLGHPPASRRRRSRARLRADGHEPRHRAVRAAVARPALQGDDEGLLEGVLGGVEVARAGG